ncbi:MAG: MarR family EPS-associated transcriptional regulator [Agarilytica sp.]
MSAGISDPKLPDELQYKLLKELEDRPDLSQRELAESVGISLGKTNYCLQELIKVGWVKVGNFAKSKSKFGYVYILTPSGLKEKTAVTLRFLKNRQEQYVMLKAEIARLKKEVGSPKE